MENVTDKSKKKKNTEIQNQEQNPEQVATTKPLLSPLLSNLKSPKEDVKAKLKKSDEDDSKTQRKGSLQEHAVIEGYLNVHSQTLLGERQKVHYFSLFPASKSARARLQQSASGESSANKLAKPEMMLLSSDIVKIEDLAGSDFDHDEQHTFLIQSRDHTLVLSASNPMERNQWISAIQEVLLSDCDSPTRKMANHFSSTENISLPRTFHVRISKKTQVRIGDDSPVDLVVDIGNLSAIASNKVRLVKWPLAMLRKYGFSSSTFYVEAGRNTESGEGEYEFITTEGEDIHRAVKAAKRSHAPEGDNVRGPPQRPSPPSFACPTYSDDIYEPVELEHPRYVQRPSRPFPPVSPHRNELVASPSSALHEKRSSGSSSSKFNRRSELDLMHRKTFSGVESQSSPAAQDSAYLFMSSKKRDISKSVTAFPIVPRKVPIVDTVIYDDDATNNSCDTTVQSQKNAADVPKSPTGLQKSVSHVPGASLSKPNVPSKPSRELLPPTAVAQGTMITQSPTGMNNEALVPNLSEIYAVVDKSKKTKKP